MPEKLTYISLFSGIGGLDIALGCLGFEIVAQVEIDDYCNQILERHWPNVERIRDIRTTDFTRFRGVDLVAGGFPCQPFSVAGKQRGEADERNMWPDTLRAIREIRPRYVFLENVSALVSNRYFGRILADLSEAGFDAEWGCFRASEVGATHRRERLFILAYASEHGWDDTNNTRTSGKDSTRENLSQRQEVGYRWRQFKSEGLGSGANVADARREHEQLQQRAAGDEHSGSVANVAHADHAGGGRRDAAGLAGTQRRQSDCEVALPSGALAGYTFPPAPNDYEGWTRVLAEMPEAQPAVCRVANELPCTLDMRTARLKALGNAVVPSQAILAFTELYTRIGG